MHKRLCDRQCTDINRGMKNPFLFYHISATATSKQTRKTKNSNRIIKASVLTFEIEFVLLSIKFSKFCRTHSDYFMKQSTKIKAILITH